MSVTQQRRYLSLTKNSFYTFFRPNGIMIYREFISSLSTFVSNELVDLLV